MNFSHATIVKSRPDADPARNSSACRSSSPSCPVISAQLTGSHRCEALGIVAIGHAPVLTLCRELLAAGIDPNSALDVFRGGLLALRVRSVGRAARLAVEDNENGRPQFRLARRPRRGAAPPMRKRQGGSMISVDLLRRHQYQHDFWKYPVPPCGRGIWPYCEVDSRTLTCFECGCQIPTATLRSI